MSDEAFVKCPTCGEDLHDIDLGARAHAKLTDEENSRLRTAIKGGERALEVANAEVARLTDAMGAVREALERIARTEYHCGECQLNWAHADYCRGAIARRALASLQTAATAGCFIVGKHPACSACGSIRLPDGKCVNGCPSSPPPSTEAPRCPTCDGSGFSDKTIAPGNPMLADCHACGGTGRDLMWGGPCPYVHPSSPPEGTGNAK